MVHELMVLRKVLKKTELINSLVTNQMFLRCQISRRKWVESVKRNANGGREGAKVMSPKAQGN